MEGIHGVDVSWLHNTQGKDKTRPKEVTTVSSPDSPTTDSTAPSPATTGSKPNTVSAPKPIPARPGFTRGTSTDKKEQLISTASSTSPRVGRRNSWLNSIKSSFKGGEADPNSTSPTASNNSTANAQSDSKAPSSSPGKNAVLPPATQPIGSAPYTPAPVRSQQPGFLQNALRRLSSSSGGQLERNSTRSQHGICERMILNVDHQRERSQCPNLKLSRLRRVAFCVDVEIASSPKYKDAAEGETASKDDKKVKKRQIEKSEGEAMKHPQQVLEQKDNIEAGPSIEGNLHPGVAEEPHLPHSHAFENGANGDATKKKEKKKRSEEERKARKEKKRKQGEANGTLPVELRNASDSSLEIATPQPGTSSQSKSQAFPTTDPARIYRRCCQLRETPILKKITEQLSIPSNSDRTGIVMKLDLSGYWMQLQDLVTLGDFLAVVPVKELLMEGCGLTDEGVRVVLAGLLAATSPQGSVHKRYNSPKTPVAAPHTGVIERVILKNNSNIGREGWRHFCLFIHMCRSIKSIDMSMNKFPPTVYKLDSAGQSTKTKDMNLDIASLLSEALEKRLAGSTLELLNIAETDISAEQLGQVVDGVIKSGLCRLGLAGNHLNGEGIEHVARYIKDGTCEGLDLGGNNLTDHLSTLTKAFTEDHPLWALSLSNCDLTPAALYQIFPTLTMLKNFRFIDLSHNHDLFTSSAHSSLGIIRKYLPKMPILKRIHLIDVNMTPDQAIALAEVFAESSTLAHVNLLMNPELSILANATSGTQQEEACALYASLMAAVRVSESLCCIDIDVPSNDSSEVVKALAKQVVAYCLRNMERGPVAEIAGAVSALTEPHGGEQEVIVPDVLLHLIGHLEGSHITSDDETAPDEDYVISGTGVVKALGICLQNSGTDSRRPSTDRAYSYQMNSGTTTPTQRRPHVTGAKAKDMSKNLLGSARKIRARLLPALVRESQSGTDRTVYRRLQFLDETLESMIKRFEDEYPETRLPTSYAQSPNLDPVNASPSEESVLSSSMLSTNGLSFFSDNEVAPGTASEDDTIPAVLYDQPRQHSVSLAARTLQEEEGRMHRFGQQFRRDILKPEGQDALHGTTGKEVWAPHLQMLRATIEELGGEEIRKAVAEGGQAAVIKELSEEASVLRQRIIESDPIGWEMFKGAQERMQRNSIAGVGPGEEQAILPDTK